MWSCSSDFFTPRSSAEYIWHHHHSKRLSCRRRTAIRTSLLLSSDCELRWSKRLRKGLSFLILASIGACVSISAPRGSTDAPVTTPGKYKREADQPVRIALATASAEGTLTATGGWELSDRNGSAQIARAAANEEWRVSVGENCSPAAGTTCSGFVLVSGGNTRPVDGPLVVRPLNAESLLKWNGKRYRGDLIVSRTDSGLLVANVLMMDSYLRGVVPLEIGVRPAAEFAAVQVQAVAARTYSYTRLSTTRAFDMYATVQDQVYGGVDAERPQSDSAIVTTRDLVVAYGGQPINAYYSSTCGGSTAGVTEVWNDRPDEPYLRPVRASTGPRPGTVPRFAR